LQLPSDQVLPRARPSSPRTSRNSTLHAGPHERQPGPPAGNAVRLGLLLKFVVHIGREPAGRRDTPSLLTWPRLTRAGPRLTLAGRPGSPEMVGRRWSAAIHLRPDGSIVVGPVRLCRKRIARRRHAK
jgi:hypothetical protein